MTRIRSNDASRVQDRRGQGRGGGFGLPGLGGGGMGIPMKSGGGLLAMLVVAAIVLLPRLLGGDDAGQDLVSGDDVASGDDTDSGTCDSELEQILCGANNDVQDFWGEEFPTAFGGPYEFTDVVFFSGGTGTSCGNASSEIGPFYCPADHLVYFDLDFLEQLQQQFGATGDLAAQYIVAHEFGHHVQNLTGQNAQPAEFAGTDNEWSVVVELQADCYAGVWAHDAASRTDAAGLPLFEPGEISEAINAARAVGDDRIQQQTQGRVDQSEWTHGSSEQRAAAFTTGFETGDPARC